MDWWKQSILCMAHIPGLGPKRIQAILETLGKEWWSSSVDDLMQIRGIGKELAHTVVTMRTQLDPVRLKESLVQQGITFLTVDDPEYPGLLRTIPYPPMYLFVQGRMDLLDRPAIAIVGTRKPTYYGMEVAKYLGREAAEHNLTVISGLARGIDRFAHEGALQAGGWTGAVLAHGLDRIYPREHSGLSNRIREQGFLISEYPPDVSAKPQQFTARNRIISGLSLCTIVVEAGWKSGALTTAEFALEQGRDVLAVPGSIFDATSIGTNTLLYEGATPVRSFADVLHVVSRVTPLLTKPLRHSPGSQRSAPTETPSIGLSEDREGTEYMSMIVERIPFTGVRVYDLVNCISNLPLAKLHLALLKLEVAGQIVRVGDTLYRKR
jgi:DNA processing protein